MPSHEVLVLSKVDYWKILNQYEKEPASPRLVTAEHFDDYMGIEYVDELNHISNDDYHLHIKDERKFLLAKLKYGFKHDRYTT